MNADEKKPTPPADRPSPAPDRPGDEGFAIAAAKMLDDFDCEDVRVLDVRGISPLTNYIVIASGTSDRQLRSLAGRLNDLGGEMGFERFGDDRDEAATWLVADFVEVMVHLFEPATRGHYDLEMLWGDAPEVNWRRAG
ncbi:MAG: ribosome silencing factor [Phycisphaeraceae bacterium]